jgi:phosphatidylserine decarboxylase
LGSTVVCLFPPQMLEFAEHLNPSVETRMGELFAQINNTTTQ